MRKYKVKMFPKDDEQMIEAKNENEAERIAMENYVLEFEDIEISEILD